jgi:predicted negative regulator of RcsB-dependent stress response
LRWVSEQGSDEGLQAIARLRLASLLVDQKAYDEALKVLGATVPASFSALVADRRGDVLMLQGRKDEARTEYSRAFKGMESANEYRRLVEVKLNALGVDPASSAGPKS